MTFLNEFSIRVSCRPARVHGLVNQCVKFASLIIFSGRKAVQEVITTTWEVERAPADVERSKKQRMTLLEESLDEPCRLRKVDFGTGVLDKLRYL